MKLRRQQPGAETCVLCASDRLVRLLRCEFAANKVRAAEGVAVDQGAPCCSQRTVDVAAEQSSSPGTPGVGVMMSALYCPERRLSLPACCCGQSWRWLSVLDCDVNSGHSAPRRPVATWVPRAPVRALDRSTARAPQSRLTGANSLISETHCFGCTGRLGRWRSAGRPRASRWLVSTRAIARKSSQGRRTPRQTVLSSSCNSGILPLAAQDAAARVSQSRRRVLASRRLARIPARSTATPSSPFSSSPRLSAAAAPTR
jgi:hypothetical protein